MSSDSGKPSRRRFCRRATRSSSQRLGASIPTSTANPASSQRCPSVSIDEAGLVTFLKDRIAGFKVPEKIWFEADNLPHLGTEKIDKVSLRAKYRAAWQEMARA